MAGPSFSLVLRSLSRSPPFSRGLLPLSLGASLYVRSLVPPSRALFAPSPVLPVSVCLQIHKNKKF